jgi:hypothetical protein
MSGQSAFPPKEFQSATIRAVLRSFDNPDGPRRFMVADEAGLGKTVVARGVIKEMVERQPRSPLVTFYMCNNQAIASQNMQQLVAFLEEETRPGAMTKADRPGLIPLFPAPTHRRLHLYPITPGTLSSSKKRNLGQGKVQERALAYALFELNTGRPIPWLRGLLSWDTASFDRHVADCLARLRPLIKAGDTRTCKVFSQFHTALSDAFQLGDRSATLAKLKQIEGKGLVTTICRNALAAAALAGLAPKLVIFDEFQRFRNLMREASEAHDDSPLARLNAHILRIVTAGTGDAKLLLLSATPYEALRMQAQAKSGPEQNDFFAVLDFLHHHLLNGQKRGAEVRRCFDLIGEQMRQGCPLSPAAVAARAKLTGLLSVVMCRTERERYRADCENGNTCQVVEVPLQASDMKMFRTFAQSLRQDDRYWAVPLWTSVPLPGQTLGEKYLCWKNAPKPRKCAEALSTSGIAEWRKPAIWPSVKARALLKTLPTAPLSMPWVRPSRTWWQLGGGWVGQSAREHADGKVLVFSRFAAVPGAVAALMSFNLECELREGKERKLRFGNYGAWSKHKYSKPQASPEVFQLFFISTLLVGIDPLADGIPATRLAARRIIAHGLKNALREHDVVIEKNTRRRPRALHLLLIALSRQCGFWEEERVAWCAALAEVAKRPAENTADAAVSAWEAAAPESLPELSSQEFDALAALALDSPAIVLARALQRHWPQALSSEAEARSSSSRHVVQALAANSLREYIDRPWFASALGETAKDDYATVLRRAVIDGNFESVLDEHFWLVSMTSNESWPKRIRQLAGSLALNGGRTLIHKPTENATNARIRCHVALPLHQAKTAEADTAKEKKTGSEDEGGETGPRPDQVRHAFNTPFWPNVLVTTSVGQEGLDFHPWCRSIAHWDPAPGPVELEQREGRVDRYAGLSIRRALAVNPVCTEVPSGGSVWTAIGQLAEGLKNANEMAPWWQVDGARTVQFYLTTPGSREAEVLRKLERGRALYRMLIGVSDPEQLLALMESREKVNAADTIKATLRLSAWELEQENVPQIRRA